VICVERQPGPVVVDAALADEEMKLGQPPLDQLDERAPGAGGGSKPASATDECGQRCVAGRGGTTTGRESGPVAAPITSSDPKISATISSAFQWSWLIPSASELLML
jgi:hypothetical protein